MLRLRPLPLPPSRILRFPCLLSGRTVLCPRSGSPGPLALSRGLCVPPPPRPPPDQAPHTDINTRTWVNRWLPAAAVPFAQLARWDRPVGTWLLRPQRLPLFPCGASCGALSDSVPENQLLENRKIHTTFPHIEQTIPADSGGFRRIPVRFVS